MRVVAIAALALSVSLAAFGASAQEGRVANALSVQAGTAGGGINDGSGKWEAIWNNNAGCTPARNVTYDIKFASPFAEPPVVTAALSAIDILNAANSRLVVEVGDVTKEGFKLKFVTWCDTNVWAAKAQWIAFGSKHRWVGQGD